MSERLRRAAYLSAGQAKLFENFEDTLFRLARGKRFADTARRTVERVRARDKPVRLPSHGDFLINIQHER